MGKLYRYGQPFGGYYVGSALDCKYTPGITRLRSTNVQNAITEVAQTKSGSIALTSASTYASTGKINWQSCNGTTVLSFIDMKLTSNLEPNSSITLLTLETDKCPDIDMVSTLQSKCSMIGTIRQNDEFIMTDLLYSVDILITVKTNGDIILTNDNEYPINSDTAIRGQLIYIKK